MISASNACCRRHVVGRTTGLRSKLMHGPRRTFLLQENLAFLSPTLPKARQP